MAARRPFWKWHRWKSIGYCLWPPSTCLWNLKLKFQSKLDLCSGNHVVYRQTDGRRDKVNPVYPPPPPPPPTSLGRGIIKFEQTCKQFEFLKSLISDYVQTSLVNEIIIHSERGILRYFLISVMLCLITDHSTSNGLMPNAPSHHP